MMTAGWDICLRDRVGAMVGWGQLVGRRYSTRTRPDRLYAVPSLGLWASAPPAKRDPGLRATASSTSF